MITKRSSHMPTLITIESIQSTNTLVLNRSNQSNCGIRTFVRIKPSRTTSTGRSCG